MFTWCHKFCCMSLVILYYYFVHFIERRPNWVGIFQMGLTSDLYWFKNISWSIYMTVLKMMSKFLLAVFTFELMWSPKVRFWSIITPRFFSFSTFSSSTSWLFDVIVYLIPVSCLPIWRWWHLMILNNIFQILAKLTALLRLYWTLLSLVFGTTAYILCVGKQFRKHIYDIRQVIYEYQEENWTKNTSFGYSASDVYPGWLKAVDYNSLFSSRKNFLTQPWILPHIS